MPKIKQSLIDQLPICDDGKQKIVELVEAMGYKFESKSFVPHVGQVWRSSRSGKNCLVIEGSGFDSGFRTVDLNTCKEANGCISLTSLQKCTANKYTLLAQSLEEYYK